MPDANDPNINEYGISVDDWDELGQDEQRDIAHEHGDDWHGRPAPAQDDDDGGSSKSASTKAKTQTSPTMPGFKTDAQREDWLAEQRQKQWDEYERERKRNVEKGRKDWEGQVREREERLREEGRNADADRLRDEREAQREQWDQQYDRSQDAGDQARRDYIDRPSIDRETRIQQYQDVDTNPERRKMREALADTHPQSSPADIEYQLWRDWAWEDAPPPPSAGRIAAAAGPNAIPLFSESLDPMEKLGWETGAEYLERVEAVQAWRDQLSQERRQRESRGEQQFPGERDVDFRERRAAMQGPSAAPQSALGYALGQLNAQGLGPDEYAAELERLSRDPWFHGMAYEREREWLAGKAGFYRSVGHAIAIGQTGMGEDLDAAIDTLKRLSAQPAITTQQLEYLDQVINSHERARETVTAAGESAIEAWEGKVLGNINAFGDPDAKARARAVLDDDGLKREERWEALAKIEAQAIAGTAHHANLAAWEGKVLSNINTFGDPDAKARAEAVMADGALTGEERRDALARIQDQAIAGTAHHANLAAWESKVLSNINTFGDPDAKARAEAVMADGALTGEERRDALARIQDQAWEGAVLGNINTFGSPEAQAQAQAVLDDGALTGEERRDALAKIQDQVVASPVHGGNTKDLGVDNAGALRAIRQAEAGIDWNEYNRRRLAEYQTAADLWEAEESMGAPEQSLLSRTFVTAGQEIGLLEHQDQLAKYHRAMADYQTAADLWEEETAMGAPQQSLANLQFANSLVLHGPLTPAEQLGAEIEAYVGPRPAVGPETALLEETDARNTRLEDVDRAVKVAGDLGLPKDLFTLPELLAIEKAALIDGVAGERAYTLLGHPRHQGTVGPSPVAAADGTGWHSGVNLVADPSDALSGVFDSLGEGAIEGASFRLAWQEAKAKVAIEKLEDRLDSLNHTAERVGERITSIAGSPNANREYLDRLADQLEAMQHERRDIRQTIRTVEDALVFWNRVNERNPFLTDTIRHSAATDRSIHDFGSWGWVPPVAFAQAVGEAMSPMGPGGVSTTGAEGLDVAKAGALVFLDAAGLFLPGPPIPFPRGAVSTSLTNIGRVTLPQKIGGGYVTSTTPTRFVPRLEGMSDEVLAASLSARQQLAQTGRATVVIDGQVITITGDRLDQALRAANPNAPTIAYHATPDATPLLSGGPVPAWDTKVPIERFQFVSPGVSIPKFTQRSAYGGTGDAPGILAYARPLDELAVPGAEGLTKSYRGARELEYGFPSGQDVPGVDPVAFAGPRLSGKLYLDPDLTAPGWVTRQKANFGATIDSIVGQAGESVRHRPLTVPERITGQIDPQVPLGPKVDQVDLLETGLSAEAAAFITTFRPRRIPSESMPVRARVTGVENIRGSDGLRTEHEALAVIPEVRVDFLSRNGVYTQRVHLSDRAWRPEATRPPVLDIVGPAARIGTDRSISGGPSINPPVPTPPIRGVDEIEGLSTPKQYVERQPDPTASQWPGGTRDDGPPSTYPLTAPDLSYPGVAFDQRGIPPLQGDDGPPSTYPLTAPDLSYPGVAFDQRGIPPLQGDDGPPSTYPLTAPDLSYPGVAFDQRGIPPPRRDDGPTPPEELPYRLIDDPPRRAELPSPPRPPELRTTTGDTPPPPKPPRVQRSDPQSGSGPSEKTCGPKGNMVYPHEVAVVLPPVISVRDIETGKERRILQGDDSDVKLLVTRWGPNPLPDREVKGPHVDVITDEAGNVGRSKSKRVHDAVRPLEKPSPVEGERLADRVAKLEREIRSTGASNRRPRRRSSGVTYGPVRPKARATLRQGQPAHPLARLGRRKHGVR